MNEKPKYLTLEFWAAILGAAAMLAVTLGIVSQEEANSWVGLLTGLVAAVLPIAALVLGYSQVRATALAVGLMAVETPGYLTLEFWMTLAATAAMVLVAAQVVSQEQADMWLQLLGPLVAAVLAIVAYVRGRLEILAAALRGAALR
jgi:hypothetical protein